MEARTAYRGSGISKSFVAVMLVVGTVGLGVAVGVVAKNLSAPAAASKAHTHISQGLGGAAQENAARRGGVQIVGGNAAATSLGAKASGADDALSTTKLTPAYIQYDTRGVVPAKVAPNSFLGPDAAERNAKLAATSAPNSFLGPDALDRNAALAAQPTKAVAANQRGHRWI